MAKSSEIDLTEILNEYKGDVHKLVEEAQYDVADKAVETLKATSPHKTGKYARGWSRKRDGRAVTVYNRTDYQLTHLLENGHLNRDGSRTPAQPHIAPVEQQVIDDFTQAVERGLE